jgi:hypothetical protein
MEKNINVLGYHNHTQNSCYHNICIFFMTIICIKNIQFILVLKYSNK